MRASLQLTITGFIALVTGALIFAFAAGASATTLRTGSYSGELASSIPTNLLPSGGDSLEYPIDPVALSWDAVPGATKYQVEVAPDAGGDCDTDSDFAPADIVASTTTTDTGFLPDMAPAKQNSGADQTNGSLIQSGDYCWHVRAADDTPGQWSPIARFTVTRNTVPTNLRFYNDTDGSIPRTPADSDYATGSSQSRNSGYLHWDAVPGATGYDVQISRSASFSNVDLSSVGTNSTNIVLPWLADEDSYYWHVRAEGGAWSSTGTFKIQRYSVTWLNNTAKYPAYGASTNDMMFGWNPVPGAAYYEVQATSQPNCFWEDTQSIVSTLWDDSSHPGCRLSSQSSDYDTTVNNWASARTVLDDQVRSNVSTSCAVTPTPSPPVNDEGHCGANDYPATVYWRVRPVWQMKSSHESLWGTSGDVSMYGAWLQDDSIPRPNMFHVSRATTYDSVAATDNRCSETPDANPIAGNNCMHLIPGAISLSDPSTNSTTLQVPLLRWGAVQGAQFPGQTVADKEPGAYRVQIAHDPFFNDIVINDTVPARTDISVPELSYSPRKGLPDDEDGYWWRVIPCQSAIPDGLCNNFYYSGAPGLSAFANVPGQAGYSDGAEPQMFTKHVESATKVSDLGESTPLLSIASAGASTAADWSRGIQGAEYYQFQISHSPTFNSSLTGPDVITTSQPRVQPFFKSSSSTGALAPLTNRRWYWRARAVDHNDLAGGWSDTSQFDVSLPAPQVTGGNGAMGAGVIGTWAPVAGATTYRVQYSTSPNFPQGTPEVVTSQLAFRIPSATLGTVYWRVRGEVGAAMDLTSDGASTTNSPLLGVWSTVNSVTIVDQTRLRYGTTADVAKAGSKVSFEGQLQVGGSNVNGQIVQLQRKSSSCAGSGSYTSIAKGRTTGDGRASMTALVLQNACYRFTYAGADSALYSAPFEVDATPVITAKVAKSKRTVSRGAKSCVAFKTNRVLNGSVTYQYMKKGGTWTDIQTGAIKAFKSKTLCFRIPVAGKLNLRANFSNMLHPTQHWSQYADTSVGLGTFQVNNVWIKKK